MHTDTPFYRLFQERPALVFELAGLPVPADLDYRLHAGEVKQTAFRLDGVLRPEAGRDDLPLVFVETQFQHRANFYARWLASIISIPLSPPRDHPFLARRRRVPRPRH